MISSELIKKLRDLTAARMMDCKEALMACDGDLEKAKDWLRKKGIASAVKKSSRVATEGVIGVITEGEIGLALEVNCETDFVSRSPDFQSLVQKLLILALQNRCQSVEDLLSLSYEGSSVQDMILATAGTLGENILLRRLAFLQVSPGQVVSYVHSPLAPSLGKIGVLVALQSDNKEGLAEVGKKIAMHIAASAPKYLSITDVPEETLLREKAILEEQAREEGPPEDVIQKIAEGIEKFFQGSVFEEQAFVFETGKKVKHILEEASQQRGTPVKVVKIMRLVLGEGV